MAVQATADGPLGRAAGETKRYAARIAKDPKACQMFPAISEGSGLAGTPCCVRGHLAGLVAAAGRRPTKAEMGRLVHDTLHDPSVRDMAVNMQADAKFPGTPHPPREY